MYLLVLVHQYINTVFLYARQLAARDSLASKRAHDPGQYSYLNEHVIWYIRLPYVRKDGGSLLVYSSYLRNMCYRQYSDKCNRATRLKICVNNIYFFPTRLNQVLFHLHIALSLRLYRSTLQTTYLEARVWVLRTNGRVRGGTGGYVGWLL